MIPHSTGKGTKRAFVLDGQRTLLEFWRALASTSDGACVTDEERFVAAVFPAWAPFNNSIALVHGNDEIRRAARDTAALFTGASVAAWAFWVPSRARRFGDPDVLSVPGLARDATTLVMRATLPGTLRTDERVVATSAATALPATDEPVALGDVDPPDTSSALRSWVFVHGKSAVAGAWTFLSGRDCGVYAVGTTAGWRGRGFARRLVEHALADGAQRGARTSSLQSTPMGRRLYESLGFRAVGRYEEWVPSADHAQGSSGSP